MYNVRVFPPQENRKQELQPRKKGPLEYLNHEILVLYWRDPYFMVYEIIPTYRGSISYISSSIYRKTLNSQGLFPLLTFFTWWNSSFLTNKNWGFQDFQGPLDFQGRHLALQPYPRCRLTKAAEAGAEVVVLCCVYTKGWTNTFWWVTLKNPPKFNEAKGVVRDDQIQLLNISFSLLKAEGLKNFFHEKKTAISQWTR